MFTFDFKKVAIEDIPSNRIPPTFRLPDNVLVLNFNYTTLADRYLPKEDIFKTIHIHGELNNPKGVIFGYGDEFDDFYSTILNKNDNSYLQHIKSYKYLEASNYRQMLSFIESAPYQIYIMGHSCGLSDKTLLRTLFENKNCISIKPFYYIKEDGSDSYMETIQNISRNLTDMTLLRDRVVNKTRCHTM